MHLSLFFLLGTRYPIYIVLHRNLAKVDITLKTEEKVLQFVIYYSYTYILSDFSYRAAVHP